MNDFLNSIRQDEKLILLTLREIIQNTAPKLKEKFSYNVPYYFGKQRVCYLWPASMSNGGFREGVSLGFCKGYLLDMSNGLLEMRGRKQVASVEYTNCEDIKEDKIIELLINAVIIDEQY